MFTFVFSSHYSQYKGHCRPNFKKDCCFSAQKLSKVSCVLKVKTSVWPIRHYHNWIFVTLLILSFVTLFSLHRWLQTWPPCCSSDNSRKLYLLILYAYCSFCTFIQSYIGCLAYYSKILDSIYALTKFKFKRKASLSSSCLKLKAFFLINYTYPCT